MTESIEMKHGEDYALVCEKGVGYLGTMLCGFERMPARETVIVASLLRKNINEGQGLDLPAGEAKFKIQSRFEDWNFAVKK